MARRRIPGHATTRAIPDRQVGASPAGGARPAARPSDAHGSIASRQLRAPLADPDAGTDVALAREQILRLFIRHVGRKIEPPAPSGVGVAYAAGGRRTPREIAGL